MPHPDTQVVDVPLRLDQVSMLMHALEHYVNTWPKYREAAQGPMLSLIGSIPPERPSLRPGPQHWVYAE